MKFYGKKDVVSNALWMKELNVEEFHPKFGFDEKLELYQVGIAKMKNTIDTYCVIELNASVIKKIQKYSINRKTKVSTKSVSYIPYGLKGKKVYMGPMSKCYTFLYMKYGALKSIKSNVTYSGSNLEDIFDIIECNSKTYERKSSITIDDEVVEHSCGIVRSNKDYNTWAAVHINKKLDLGFIWRYYLRISFIGNKEKCIQSFNTTI
jgi:hypothetical protein